MSRADLSRRAFTAGLCGCGLMGLGACTAHQTGSAYDLADATPGYRPDPKTDEAGIWQSLDKVEAEMRTAGNRVRDKAINDYMTDILCRLASSYCPDLRTYVLRIPSFNAGMYPNGMTAINTGLLLRARSESQVAAVLGHEFGHFRRRHSLARMRDMRVKSDIVTVLSVGVAAAGVPGAGGINNSLMLGANATVLAFSREHEREADSIGFEVMAAAGYDPFEAGAIWKRLMDIEEASEEDNRPDVFTSTHPLPEEREETLRKKAEALGRPALAAPNRLHEIIAPIRGLMLADEVNLGTFKRSEKLFDLLIADGFNIGEVLYHKGELYRRRNREGDEALALGFYHQAVEARGAPPEALRQVGMVRWRRGDREAAREYLRRYLNAKPDAFDRDMIQSYLKGA